MHMADALISPVVGGALWAATAVTTVYCAKKVREELDESRIPLMGVAGAFVFAAQMLNFTIPGTGSSGHLGGGLILAALLGPYAAFLVMASVLGVQALFFADGGLLALGANVFNLGIFPAFIAYPYIYRKIVGSNPSNRRILVGSLAGAIIGLQLGALGVVLETTLSGVSELPFTAFALVMQPIHLAIGVVEGLVTAGVIVFVNRAQPEILKRDGETPRRRVATGPVLAGLLVATLLSAGVFSWFASTNADGLEWSISRLTGAAEISAGSSEALHESAASAQNKTAILPEYGLPTKEEAASPNEADSGAPWPAVDGGRSLAGIVGAAITLALAGAIGVILKRRSARRNESSATI
ncbi:MAG: energy-coupling factor ABC transporter permease [Actinobacteria bacterium]|nr:energy-coupling factor ABC transporter permease [Actinomycetota bacterium]MCG2807832.1 energy-coupling factor ABC transporter permease [Coriobacteriia bacterium]